MKRYVLTGPQPLEFADLRVEPSVDGTLFEYELEPAKEALLVKSGVITVLPEGAEPRKGRR